MSDTVLVYRGEEIAAYGFGDTHPFGVDRHDVFHSELDKAGLADSIDYGHPPPASAFLMTAASPLNTCAKNLGSSELPTWTLMLTTATACSTDSRKTPT